MLQKLNFSRWPPHREGTLLFFQDFSLPQHVVPRLPSPSSLAFYWVLSRVGWISRIRRLCQWDANGQVICLCARVSRWSHLDNVFRVIPPCFNLWPTSLTEEARKLINLFISMRPHHKNYEIYSMQEILFLKLTILYCSSSIMWVILAYRSNKEMFKPNDLATLFFTIGWSCLWSPIRTTCSALEQAIGTIVSGSVHIPDSSTMHWRMLLLSVTTLLLPEAEQVQRIIWWYRPLQMPLMTHFSASCIN